MGVSLGTLIKPCYTKLVMKSFPAILILVSFIGAAILGFATMGHTADHSRTNCIVAATQNIDCTSSNLGAFLAIHFNAFKNISSAVFAKNYASILTMLWLVTLWFILVNKIKPTEPTLQRAYIYKFQPSTPNNLRLKLNAWLSRQENSPANF